MYVQLRVRTFNAQLSEADQQIPVEDPGNGIDVILRDLHHEFQSDAGGSQGLDPQILGWGVISSWLR